jgi:hypothetical protein
MPKPPPVILALDVPEIMGSLEFGAHAAPLVFSDAEENT